MYILQYLIINETQLGEETMKTTWAQVTRYHQSIQANTNAAPAAPHKRPDLNALRIKQQQARA